MSTDDPHMVPAPISEMHTTPPPRWFQRRPIAAWIILAASSLQMFGIFSAMAHMHYLDLIESGEVPIHQAALGLAFPLLLFIGSLSLFLMRKISVAFFVAYLVWGVIKMGLGAPFVSYIELGIVVGIIIYCLRLASQGRLR